MKVLIIEDDIDFRNTLKEELHEKGIDTLIIENHSQIESIPSVYSHAIVDLRLKGQSGLDFIEPLRAKFPKIKICILTAYASVATTVKAMKLGAHNYLQKPCTIEELLNALEYSGEDEVLSENLPSLHKKEREYIEYVLSLHNGNISRAAESLGIRRQSLQRKLKKYPPKN
ncbi:MAG: response regulator [Bacteriovoracaceae bacterium]|nr:response regulator [Bacteriovoracaceae bacterium]